MKKTDFFTIEFISGSLRFIDQTKLPNSEVYINTASFERIAEAIERLEIRGAPAIGVAAAYALALSLKDVETGFSEVFEKAYNRLAGTRPTAVNLFWSLNEIRTVFEANPGEKNIYSLLLSKAEFIYKDDIEKCRRISENGLPVFKKKSAVLTHCNAGKLATVGSGTAIGVISYAFEKGLVEHVYADETRPLFQGSRLTAYELEKSGIPFSIQIDSAAAVLMQKKIIDIVVVGADRITRSGDAANKIGTYNLAVLCKYHNIPFYIAAPTSTIDKSIISGNDINVEQRNKDEVLKINNMKISKEYYNVFTPAFDVTPHYLISGIITEDKLYYPPFDFK